MNKKTTHGGARTGAGRKDPVKKKGWSFSLSLPVLEKVLQEKSPSALVEELLRRHYGIETNKGQVETGPT